MLGQGVDVGVFEYLSENVSDTLPVDETCKILCKTKVQIQEIQNHYSYLFDLSDGIQPILNEFLNFARKIEASGKTNARNLEDAEPIVVKNRNRIQERSDLIKLISLSILRLMGTDQSDLVERVPLDTFMKKVKDILDAEGISNSKLSPWDFARQRIGFTVSQNTSIDSGFASSGVSVSSSVDVVYIVSFVKEDLSAATFRKLSKDLFWSPDFFTNVVLKRIEVLLSLQIKKTFTSQKSDALDALKATIAEFKTVYSDKKYKNISTRIDKMKKSSISFPYRPHQNRVEQDYLEPFSVKSVSDLITFPHQRPNSQNIKHPNPYQAAANAYSKSLDELAQCLQARIKDRSDGSSFNVTTIKLELAGGSLSKPILVELTDTVDACLGIQLLLSSVPKDLDAPYVLRGCRFTAKSCIPSKMEIAKFYSDCTYSASVDAEGELTSIKKIDTF